MLRDHMFILEIWRNNSTVSLCAIPAFPMHQFISWYAEMLPLFPKLFGSVVDLNLFDQQIFRKQESRWRETAPAEQICQNAVIPSCHNVPGRISFAFLEPLFRMLIPPCHLDSDCCLAASQASRSAPTHLGAHCCLMASAGGPPFTSLPSC